MPSFHEYRRLTILPLTALALAAYYVFFYLPLERRSRSLDAPLQQSWKKLAESVDQTNALALDFAHITNQLAETRQAVAVFENTKKKAIARLELGASVRAKMSAPFQLVDYENDRSKQITELGKTGTNLQAKIEPAVFAGFPEHTADVKQPSLLWAELSLIDSLLGTALQCKVSTINDLSVPLALTNAPPASSGPDLVEIPVQVEFTAPVASVARLLRSLPLRTEELRATLLPEAPLDKPPLFVDRLVLKKQSPDKPDEVRVSLRAIGFVLRERP
jgi:type II secretory pathway component PulM